MPPGSPTNRNRRNRATACAATIAVSLLASALLLRAPTVSAQRLPFRHYGVADGLAHNQVGAIHQDAQGYLWFGTSEGLSRFDGYRFTNYGLRDGLPNFIINVIVEDRQGRLWVGTNGGGVARLVDQLQTGQSGATGRKKFISYPVGETRFSNRVNDMLFDADDNLWCATDHGLYRATAISTGTLKFEAVVSHRDTAQQMAAFADNRGQLWFGIRYELVQIAGDRLIRHAPPGKGFEDEAITGITQDRQGRLLVAFASGLFELVAPADASGRGQWKKLALPLGRGQKIQSLLLDSTDALWIATSQGLIKYREDGQREGGLTIYTSANGLGDNWVLSLKEDRQGNLWIGTFGGGVYQFAGETMVSFTRAEGLPEQSAGKIIESHDGRIYACTSNHGLAEIVNGKAVPVPGSDFPPPRNLGVNIIQDRRGDWWAGLYEGLFHFPGPTPQFQHGRKITAANLPPEALASVVQLFPEDADGMLWVGAYHGLYRFDPTHRERPVFERIAENPRRMFIDRSGGLWVAEFNKGLHRRLNGKTVAIAPAEGPLEPQVNAFFQDSRGWLWIGLRYHGALTTTDPAAEHPKFVNYSTQHGLASDVVRSVTEDDFGRIYLSTDRGLAQLDPGAGRIRNFTTADGLAGDLVQYCLKDRSGNIWVAAYGGVSKYNPRAERKQSQPATIYLSRVNAAGEDLPLPETGAVRLPQMTFPSSLNNLFIEYVGLDFQDARALKYQYKLEGVDADWSAPTEQRVVNYARIAPGSYRFLVRAVNPGGLVSPEPATFEFRILPPIWQRWWFLALAAVAAGLMVYAAHRYRVAQLIEMERVRTRIAADLHDDIGSNLSQIALLSEVVRQQVGRANSQAVERLSLIANISRQTVDSMSDIVWAVNPQRDRLSDLAQRMRRFADDTLSARGIELRFSADGIDRDLKLGTDTRREVFLVSKEAVNNIARHSECTAAEIEFRLDDGWLELKVSDDGRGFDPAEANGGNGLVSMRMRAERLGGEFEATSQLGRGTTVRLRAPVNQNRKHLDGI